MGFNATKILLRYEVERSLRAASDPAKLLKHRQCAAYKPRQQQKQNQQQRQA
jgi:hypothetical protein